MANRKKQTINSNATETPFLDDLLRNLPLAFRNMVRQDTDSIGELYRRVKFSSSKRHMSAQYSNFPLMKPISNILLRSEDESETEE